MNIRLILSLIFFFFFHFVNAQHIGATLNLGWSKTPRTYPFYNHSTHNTKSGKIGAIIETNVKKNIIGIGFLFVQMEGRKIGEIQYYDQLNALSVVNKWEDRMHRSYLGIPFYYRFKLGRFGVKSGVQTLFLFKANISRNLFREINASTITLFSRIEKDFKISKFDIGPLLGVGFDLTSRLRLTTDYYFGILDDDASFSMKKNSIQITFGLVSFLN